VRDVKLGVVQVCEVCGYALDGEAPVEERGAVREDSSGV
jgi:hypothetical protein